MIKRNKGDYIGKFIDWIKYDDIDYDLLCCPRHSGKYPVTIVRKKDTGTFFCMRCGWAGKNNDYQSYLKNNIEIDYEIIEKKARNLRKNARKLL